MFFEAFIIIWIVIEIYFMWVLIRTKPSKEITSKYRGKVLFYSQLPFGKYWKAGVKQEDLGIMETYQNNIQKWYLSVIIPFILFFIALYLVYIE